MGMYVNFQLQVVPEDKVKIPFYIERIGACFGDERSMDTDFNNVEDIIVDKGASISGKLVLKLDQSLIIEEELPEEEEVLLPP